MNKLTEYRDKEADKQDNYSKDYPHSECYIAGFDAAMSLDLPVKFAEWLATSGIKIDGRNGDGEITWMKYVGASHTNQGTTKELFYYWIENIYKPE